MRRASMIWVAAAGLLLGCGGDDSGDDGMMTAVTLDTGPGTDTNDPTTATNMTTASSTTMGTSATTMGTSATTMGTSATTMGTTDPGDGTSTTTGEVNCEYPAGAVEPMALNEVISPYSWPEAIDASGTEWVLDLAEVPCDMDTVIDWSPFDVLVFVSLPAW